jgi:serine/threonine-protein phosphatase 2A catalytic subunit
VAILEESDITRCLEQVHPVFEKEPTLVEIRDRDVVFVGDLHGDFETTKAIVGHFLDADRLVFLGDFIDREPMKWGAIYTIIYLFVLKIRYPEKFILLRGNHESNDMIPCYPYEFKAELRQRFGSSVLHKRFIDVFSVMPLMMRTSTIFGAHGGILKGADTKKLRTIQKNDRRAVESLVWSDPTLSLTFRGAGDVFSEEELLDFLDRISTRVLIRSHDFTQLGFSIFHDRCLTILSCRQYSDMGNQGILVARTHKNVSTVSDVRVEDFSSGEWKKYRIKKR